MNAFSPNSVADINKALVGTLEEINDLGMDYSAKDYVEPNEENSAVMAILSKIISVRFGYAGLTKALELSLDGR